MSNENEIKFYKFIAGILAILFFSILIIFPFSFIILVWNNHQWVENLILTELILIFSSFFTSCFFAWVAKMLEEENSK